MLPGLMGAATGGVGCRGTCRRSRLDPPGFLLRRAVAGGPVAPLRLGRRSATSWPVRPRRTRSCPTTATSPRAWRTTPASAEPGPPLALAFGNGLLSSSGAHHARQRRLMQPTFSHASVAGYADRMAEEAERFAALLAPTASSSTSTPALSEVTLHILTRTVFDTPLPAGRRPGDPVGGHGRPAPGRGARADPVPQPGRRRAR